MKNILLCILGAVIVLRIVIWKFFSTPLLFVKEDLSNLLVALLLIPPAIFWLVGKVRSRQGFRQTDLEWPILLLLGAAVCSLGYTADLSASAHSVPVLFSHILIFFSFFNPFNCKCSIFLNTRNTFNAKPFVCFCP